MVALYPNSTHIIQPLDVAVFGPLKSKWKRIVKQWRIENDTEISKFDISLALSGIINNPKMKKKILNQDLEQLVYTHLTLIMLIILK